MEPAYRYRAQIARVIDGDSFYVSIDLGFRITATHPVRLRGVNCPELGTEEGEAARTFVGQEVGARPLILESYRDKQSFARWICDIWVLQDHWGWTSLADMLIESGHGVAA